jgi:proteasome lid subunit RPN8/RPN11
MKKRKVLLEKYPQFVSLNIESKQNYLQRCVKNSLNINEKLLGLGIKVNQPKLKRGTVESFNNSDEYCSYLAAYVSSDNYVETFLVVFTDGTAITYTDNRNTSSTVFSPGFSQSNDIWYVNGYPNRPVSYVAHTHLYSTTPSSADIAFGNNHPGLSVAIYYSGTMSYYNSSAY